MPESRIDRPGLGGSPCGDLSGYLFERFQMPARIAIPPSVIGDDGLAVAEEVDQIVGCVHGGIKHADQTITSR